MGDVQERIDLGRTPAGVTDRVRSRRSGRLSRRRSVAIAVVGLIVTSLMIGRGAADGNGSVALAAAPTTSISDSFSRSVTRGWGSAEAGGAYSYADPGAFSVNGQQGVIKIPGPGQSRTTKLPVKTTNQTTTASLGITALSTSGNGVSIALLARDGDGKAYRAAVRIAPGGKTSLELVRINGSTAATTPLKSVSLPYVIQANTMMTLELTTGGTTNVDISARAWPRGTTAPNPQITYTDKSGPITTPGVSGIWTYASGSSQAATVLIDNLKVTDNGTTTTTPTPTPTRTTTQPTTTAPATTTPKPSTTAPTTTRSSTSVVTTSTPPSGTVSSTSSSRTTSSSATTPPAGSSGSSGYSGFPNASNTGVPAGTNLTTYTGPCTIQTPNTVIDSKTINCDLGILTSNVVIKNSKVNGQVFIDTDRTGGTGWSATIQDSEIDGGQQQRATISNGNLTVLRSNVHGGITGVQCDEHSSKCLIQDSWIHGQYMLPGSDWHLGGILSNGTTNFTIRHNTVVCDATDGCTGDINLIPNFAPISGALVENNLLKGNPKAAYCTYGGEKSTSPYPHSDHIVYRNNVFERGPNSKCAAYGPVTSFNSSGTGNNWQNNTWDDGTIVNPAN